MVAVSLKKNFFQAEDGIRDFSRSRGLGDVYKRQVNGIRFSLEDGSWGLIRASSNKPSLVVVTESPTSDELKKEIFYFIDKLLQETGKIGEYDQKIN